MKKILGILVVACSVIFLPSFQLLHAQGPLRRNLPTSPTAGSFGIFSQVEVDYSTGLPNVNVPLYSIESGGLSFPIALRYHASGVRPDIRAGWTGLNWSLNCLPSITRIIHGDPDEAFSPNDANPNSMAYYYHTGLLDRTDWYSVGVIDELGSKYLTGWSTPASGPEPIRPIPAPDEFVFNFFGYSGSFFLDHKGQWKFKSDNSNLTLLGISIEDHVAINAPPAEAPAYQGKARTITGFTLLDDRGNKFYFGRDETRIEYSRNELPSGHDPEGVLVNAVTWYLYRVENLINKPIDFEYERAWTYQVNKSESFDMVSFSGSGFGYGRQSFSEPKNLVNAVYLKRIHYENGFLDFTRSETNEDVYDSENFQAFLGYDDFEDYQMYHEPKYYKLDKIDVYHNGSVVRTFQFQYSAGARLMLTSVKEIGSDQQEKEYKFNYYSDPAKPLPPYVSRQLDHWGFWNGTSFFTNPQGYTQNDVPAYHASRAPNLSYAKIGTLQKVTYPTGGYTIFDYELNSYSKVVNYYGRNNSDEVTADIDLDDANSTNEPAGGLRIASIKNYNNTTNIIETRLFEYKLDDGTTSSGILNGLPRYSESGTIDHFGNQIEYFRWNNYSVQPFGFTNGSHIGYRQVKEILPDGSYIVRKYTSQATPGALDKPRENAVVSQAFAIVPPFTSMEMERGLLTHEIHYSSSGVKVKEIELSYNNNPNRFEEYIRYIDFKLLRLDPMGGTATVFTPFGTSYTMFTDILQGFSYKKYIYKQFQTEVKETVYDPSGLHGIQNSQITSYTAEGYPREKISYTSDGKQLKTIYRYVNDFSNSTSQSAGIPGLMTLKSKRVLNIPVETISVLADASGSNPKILGATLNIFKSNQPVIEKVYELKLIAPIPYVAANFNARINTTTGTLVFHPNYKETETVTRYDEYNNPLEMSRPDNIKTSFIYGYNHKLPIAAFTNASVSDVGYNGFEDDDWNDLSIYTYFKQGNTGHTTFDAHTGKRGFNIAPFTIGPYHDFVPADQTGKFVFSCWVKTESSYSGQGKINLYTYALNSPSANYPINSYSNVSVYFTNTSGKWQYIEVVLDLGKVKSLSGISSVLGIRASVKNDYDPVNHLKIDDLRFQPIKATSIYYSYDPLVGMTSETDDNNRSTYYHYDGLGRLVAVQDNDRNVVKRYCYNYSGQAENCNLNTNAMWVPQGPTRCLPCPADANYSQPFTQTYDLDINPLSPTYGQYAWTMANVYSTPECLQPDWHDEGAPECLLNSMGTNSGYMTQLQRDKNPCSNPPNTTQVITYQDLNGCPVTIYASISYENVGYYGTTVVGDIVVRFYSDPNREYAISVTNLDVNYYTSDICFGGSNYTINCNGQSTVIATGVYLVYDDPYYGNGTCYIDYYVDYGNGYTPL